MKSESPGVQVCTLEAAYRVYMGNGMEAIPEDMFKIRPFPLWKEDHRLQVCVKSWLTSSDHVNMGRKPVRHARKNHFAHLGKKRMKCQKVFFSSSLLPTFSFFVLLFLLLYIIIYSLSFKCSLVLLVMFSFQDMVFSFR